MRPLEHDAWHFPRPDLANTYLDLKKAELLMDAKPSSSGADNLEVLSLLIEAYESKYYPIVPVD
jgi:antitoxin component HigA of HigAB toxin-antitoxin module